MEHFLDKEKPKPTPLTDFLHSQTAGGIVLIIVSLIAFTLANITDSSWHNYEHFLHTHASIEIGEYHVAEHEPETGAEHGEAHDEDLPHPDADIDDTIIEMDHTGGHVEPRRTVIQGSGGWEIDLGFAHWVNDGLMVIFFFLVGLEIKREVLVGELSSPKKASLAVFAAVGGMIFPAVIYSLIALPYPNVQGGWGIPMATDIAFAIGVLSLLGKKVPISLKVFLTALAIVDDLGAIVVIAIFYNSGIDWLALLGVVGFVFTSLLYGKTGGTKGWVYTLLTVGCWYFMFKSGLHATLAGVVMALTIPIKHKYSLQEINTELKKGYGEEGFGLKEKHLHYLEKIIRKSQSPLHRFEHKLHPWVVFGVMPIFAFFNAGVHIPETLSTLSNAPHMIGIFCGLVFGKPIGVLLASWIAVKTGLASLPEGVNWTAMTGVGFLAGLGFAMSLFIAVLAFPGGDMAQYLAEAKIAILVASITATCIGGTLTWMGVKKAA